MESHKTTATFHLTHNCNLRCTYCYTGEKFGTGMTDATAAQAVDFAIEEARRQASGHLEVIFFGGEPLLRHDLLCAICDRVRARAPDLETSFKTSTNGTLLTPAVMEDLAAREVYVSLSLDGDPAVQDAQRPDAAGAGSAARVERAIDVLLAHNPCANVTCVITPETAHRADRSVQWIFGRGFSYVTTTLDYGADWTAASLDALKAAYGRLAEWYVDTTRRRRKFYLSCFDERIRTHTEGPLAPSERCSIGYGQFSIAPSGRLYPCVQFVHEDEGDWAIGDVWRGFDGARRDACHGTSETERGECSGCALSERCSSWCACVNFQSTGRIDRPSPVVCEHERLLLPIADRVAAKLWKQRDPSFIHKHYNPAYPVLSFVEDLIVEDLIVEDLIVEDLIVEENR